MSTGSVAEHKPKRRIGVDFDNTLISYDDVFAAYAADEGIVVEGEKRRKRVVRDSIRALPEGETRWQALQGRVYGKGIAGAVPVEGAIDFLRKCREAAWDVLLISHKTEFGHFDPDRVNLRAAAVTWLERHGFFEACSGLSRVGVYWESTREAKLERIASSGCDLFIDDLEEVLCDERFPAGVERVLLADIGAGAADAPYVCCPTWAEVERHVFH